jgi:penicillin-binding protein-related factor A (putative recombinase)
MNQGKIFEENFKKSIPRDTYWKRLNDSSIGFDIENSTQRFALKSPYDYILYRKGKMYCLELKSTKDKAISYTGSNPKIKEHQIKELIKASEYGCEAGFILNFRSTENTYYLPIAQFNFLVHTNNKKSFSESDIKGISILIPSKKLKVNYRYDLTVLVGGD